MYETPITIYPDRNSSTFNDLSTVSFQKEQEGLIKDLQTHFVQRDSRSKVHHRVLMHQDRHSIGGKMGFTIEMDNKLCEMNITHFIIQLKCVCNVRALTGDKQIQFAIDIATETVH